MFSNFQENIRNKEMSNLRTLNVFASVAVTVLGFLFEFVYHDGYILVAGLLVSVLFTSNYFLSFYSQYYKKNFQNISYVSVFLLHFWAVYVTYMRSFDLAFLLPLTLSIFIFSLIFDKFFKSFVFIFIITTFLFVMMIASHQWHAEYIVALISLYSGSVLANLILRRKKDYHMEIDKQERRYVSLIENMNDGLIYLDNDLRLKFVNDKFCEITGYSKEELVGEKITELSPDTGLNSSSKIFYTDLQNGVATRSDYETIKKNGEIIRTQIFGSPIKNDAGENVGSMVVYADITNLKNVQEQLKRSEEGYRTFINQSAVGIWRDDYNPPISVQLPIEEQIDLLLNTGKISECNDFMARMYGYQHSSELIGRRTKDFYLIENNFDEEKTREHLGNFIKNNYSISNAESKEIDKNGNVRYISNNNIGILENGFLVRTWGVQTDVTDRRKTERELQETNEELDTFFYKASHDLKGPLASIMGIANVARMENKDELVESYFGMIESSVKKLDRTLLDLIELARTRKGSSKLSAINIKSLVDEILLSLSHVKEFEKINFEIHIDPSVKITSDKVLMLSVFQNLIHNAINYCNKQSPWIRIHVRETDNGIELEVTDNGRGIAENVKNKMFEMFYRGHPDSNGSGLGLFIVKNALEKMKGKIRFESETGKGTSFFVEIPNALVEA